MKLILIVYIFSDIHTVSRTKEESCGSFLVPQVPVSQVPETTPKVPETAPAAPTSSTPPAPTSSTPPASTSPTSTPLESSLPPTERPTSVGSSARRRRGEDGGEGGGGGEVQFGILVEDEEDHLIR